MQTAWAGEGQRRWICPFDLGTTGVVSRTSEPIADLPDGDLMLEALAFSCQTALPGSLQRGGRLLASIGGGWLLVLARPPGHLSWVGHRVDRSDLAGSEETEDRHRGGALYSGSTQTAASSTRRSQRRHTAWLCEVSSVVALEPGAAPIRGLEANVAA